MTRAARAGLAYALAVFACGFGLGIIRNLWLIPRVGALAAVTIEVPIMLILSWWLCGWAIGHYGVGSAFTTRVLMAAAAFVMAFVAEATGARWLGGLSISGWIASFGTPAGLVGLTGQLGFVALPLLRRRGVDTADGTR